jgi:hypothetical protein
MSSRYGKLIAVVAAYVVVAAALLVSADLLVLTLTERFSPATLPVLALQ